MKHIEFFGASGSGKTTNAFYIRDFLLLHGKSCVTYKETSIKQNIHFPSLSLLGIWLGLKLLCSSIPILFCYSSSPTASRFQKFYKYYIKYYVIKYNCDFLIIDEGFIALCLSWFDVSKVNKRVLTNYMKIINEISKDSIIFVCHLDIKESLHRANARTENKKHYSEDYINKRINFYTTKETLFCNYILHCFKIYTSQPVEDVKNCVSKIMSKCL